MPSRLLRMVKAMQREKTIYLQGFTILGIQIIEEAFGGVGCSVVAKFDEDSSSQSATNPSSS